MSKVAAEKEKNHPGFFGLYFSTFADFDHVSFNSQAKFDLVNRRLYHYNLGMQSTVKNDIQLDL